MSAVHIVLALVLAQRLAELALAHRNTRRLLAQGAVESGAGHYPLFIVLHGGWLAALTALVPAEAPPSWPLLGLFLGLQAGRLWVIATLGSRWTTRIITLPGAPLATGGPYRVLRHPNYAIVAAEIVVLPLAFGAAGIALAFGVPTVVLLAHRIRVEEAALVGARVH